ncbi:AAA family ATPase [Silvanigrella sp.]|jgi:predicted ATPase|uniref:AAA family ATPase n=1 Tax=Silvanigrella sp. TaxID=2024976 RepID=UPI0037C91489
MGKSIKSLTIRGFKSIKKLDEFHLNQLNILIGANGAGKSNFVSYFKLLSELVEKRLQSWTSEQGEADRIISFGVKETKQIESSIRFADNGYDFVITPTVDGGFVFEKEQLYFDGPLFGITRPNLGTGHKESKLKEEVKAGNSKKVALHCFNAISKWKVYHFHDTTDTAAVKRKGSLHDNDYLRSDASNLAAFLYKLKKQHSEIYELICKNIRLAIPFFDDFVLKPQILSTEEELINLVWKQKDSDYPLWPSQLSDGSIRFICLVTVLLQPDPPATIIIDEPELGLHPFAITLLGALLRSASTRMQVIVSTQSVPLLNEFTIEDLIVVERDNGNSIFKRLNEDDFSSWLENYSVGELWEKNILGGRPSK